MSARGFRWDWLTFGKNILSMAARDCRLPRRDPRKPQKPHCRHGTRWQHALERWKREAPGPVGMAALQASAKKLDRLFLEAFDNGAAVTGIMPRASEMQALAHHRQLFMQPIPFTPEDLKAQGFTFAEPDDE